VYIFSSLRACYIYHPDRPWSYENFKVWAAVALILISYTCLSKERLPTRLQKTKAAMLVNCRMFLNFYQNWVFFHYWEYCIIWSCSENFPLVTGLRDPNYKWIFKIGNLSWSRDYRVSLLLLCLSRKYINWKFRNRSGIGSMTSENNCLEGNKGR
jgi:hypothetical protein